MKYLFLTLISISSIALATPKPKCIHSWWIYGQCSSSGLKCELKLEYKNPVGSEIYDLKFFYDLNHKECKKMANVRPENYMKEISKYNTSYILGALTNPYNQNQGDPTFCRKTCGRKKNGRRSAHLNTVNLQGIYHTNSSGTQKNGVTVDDTIFERNISKIEIGECDCSDHKFYLNIR